MTGIYQITNVENGKIYIGQSQDIERRFHDHKNSPQPKMREDVEIFGWDSFKFEVLEECSLEVLNDRENFYIEKLNPEYNTIKLHNWTHTPETCEKIRQAKLGSHHTEKACEKMSKSRKGTQLSDEHKEKCRQKSIGNKSRSRPVICVETGIEYENAKIAAQAVGLKSSTIINNVIRGESITAGGFHWKCADENVEITSRNRKVFCVETGETFSSVQETAEHFNLTPSVVSKVLHGRSITAGLHFKFADETRAVKIISEDERRNHLPIPVICVETGEEFESVRKAAKKFGIISSSISSVLSGKAITAGGLHFKFADESLNKNIRTDESRKISSSKSVMCIETNEIFPSVKAAAEHFGLKNSNICRMLKGGAKKVGGFRFKYV